MAYSHYERLSALDSTFLEVESPNAHMHVGSVALFDAGPLTGAHGVIDFDRLQRGVEAALHREPRYRQRLAYIPLFGYPVWVDDEHFNLNYHLRHVCLPHPGDPRQLKRLAGRIMSQQLDRGRPLWELWIVEGVEGDRVALISKAHHCMIDGVGSAELMGAMMRATAETERQIDHPPVWLPRPVPTPTGLLLSELGRRAAEPFAALGAARAFFADPLGTAAAVGNSVLGVGEAIGAGIRPASPTPLNIDIGPHRRFDWLDMDLAEVRDIKNRLGGTLNDLVLAIVSGALGRFLHARGLHIAELDFRAMVPVNVRTDDERASMGNRVAMMVARLPLAERDPRRRLQLVRETTQKLKHSRQALGVRTLEEISDWTLTSVFSAFVSIAAFTRPYNVVVTNVPGPQFSAYFLGAPLRAVYPLVPLYRNQALGIALFSYSGGLYWGFNADWDAVPDLHDLVASVAAEFDSFRSAASLGPLPTATQGRRRSAAKPAPRPATLRETSEPPGVMTDKVLRRAGDR